MPGREPALDYEAITGAAIALADLDGLDAVSMRKIADRVDSGTMSLYRYVNGKDDLIELMYDSALGELELAEHPVADWRTELAELARRSRRLCHRHPWISRIGQRPTMGPNAVRMMEYAMASVDGLGLTVDGMLDLVSTTMHFTQGYVQAELTEAEARRRTGTDEATWREVVAPYLKELLGDGRHPYLGRIIAEADNDAHPDVVFERRLAMVLEGLAHGLP
ncbi:TetR/AcrR family transcriptional regulator [Nonomuraea sp. NPDC050556]|uniref:TetR/AcrR family transcriptional regulator n=1 Tax=Nonomuraea sp. NPDC050556 TaxID=3364369 RepID=UPI0037BD1186